MYACYLCSPYETQKTPIPVFIFTSTSIIHNNWTKVYTLCIIIIITLHRRNSKFSIYVKITMVTTTTADILRSACAGSCSRSLGHFCFSFERIKELLRQVHTKRTKKTSITDAKKILLGIANIKLAKPSI